MNILSISSERHCLDLERCLIGMTRNCTCGMLNQTPMRINTICCSSLEWNLLAQFFHSLLQRDRSPYAMQSSWIINHVFVKSRNNLTCDFVVDRPHRTYHTSKSRELHCRGEMDRLIRAPLISYRSVFALQWFLVYPRPRPAFSPKCLTGVTSNFVRICPSPKGMLLAFSRTVITHVPRVIWMKSGGLTVINSI